MKTTMLSKLLYGSSVIVVIVAIIQWTIRVQDMSQLAFGLHIALTLMMAAYLHTVLRYHGDQIKDTDRALDVAIDYTKKVEDTVKKI